MDLNSLKAGDCLLYKATGLYGRAITLKTWHDIGHVEVYVGKDHEGRHIATASRDRKGVDFYPLREKDLLYVLRPTVPLDIAAGFRYARRMVGTPYGWRDLLNFIGWNVDRHGIVCSPYATAFYRACGWRMFPEDSVNQIAPFQFLSLVGHGFDIHHKKGR